METTIVTWKTIHLHGDLWWQSHTLRKKQFVDMQGWDIPHTEMAEWDQYDTPMTVYCITHEANRILASSRLLPCNIKPHNGWSYMLHDSASGLLPGIPDAVTTLPIQDELAWEATRFCVDPDLDANLKNEALRANAIALHELALELGASKLFSIMHPGFIRWLKSAGLPARRLSKTVVTPTGDKICAIVMKIGA